MPRDRTGDRMRIKYELFVNGKYLLSTWSNEKAFREYQNWRSITGWGEWGNVRLKFRRVAA